MLSFLSMLFRLMDPLAVRGSIKLLSRGEDGVFDDSRCFLSEDMSSISLESVDPLVFGRLMVMRELAMELIDFLFGA